MDLLSIGYVLAIYQPCTRMRILTSVITQLSLNPYATALDDVKSRLLAAVSDTEVDRSLLERFRDWTVSTVQSGPSAAVAGATLHPGTEAWRRWIGSTT